MGIFLFISLFVPRLGLFAAWLFGGIPFNNVPFIFDLLGALIFPRILIIYYIWYAELGTGWMVAHVIALIIALVVKLKDDD